MVFLHWLFKFNLYVSVSILLMDIYFHHLDMALLMVMVSICNYIAVTQIEKLSKED